MLRARITFSRSISGFLVFITFLLCHYPLAAEPLPGDFLPFIRGCDLTVPPGPAEHDRINPAKISEKLAESKDAADALVVSMTSQGTDFNSMYLLDARALRVDSDGTQHLLIRKAIRVAGECDRERTDVKIHFNSRCERLELVYARVITPEGEIIPVTTDSSVEQLTVYEIMQFYSDLKMLVIPFNGCAPGTVLDYEYIVHRRTPLVPGEFEILFSIQGLVPYLENLLAVAVPAGKKVWYASPRLEQSGLPVRFTAGGYDVRVWNTDLTPPLIRETNMPQYADLSPFIAVTSMKQWSTIARRLLPRIMVAVTPTDEIRKVVDRLVAGAQSLEEKVCRVFEFVQREIVPVEIDLVDTGLTFIPANKVLVQGYGAPLEKSTLLVSMLRSLGVRAVHGLISTRENGRIAHQLPLLSQFNHVLVLAELENRLLFLDPSAEWLSFPHLPAEDQGRSVLPLEEGCMGLISTPCSSEQDNFVRERLEMDITMEGTVEVRSVSTAGGEVDRSYRREFASLSPALLKQTLSRAVETLYPGGVLVNCFVSDPRDMSCNMSMGLTFNSSRYVKEKDDVLTVTIPGLHYARVPQPGRGRKHPLCFRFPFKAETRVTIFFPEKLQLVSSPDNIEIETEIGLLEAGSQLSAPGKLSVWFRYVRRKTEIGPEYFPIYVHQAQKSLEFSQKPVVFRKKCGK